MFPKNLFKKGAKVAPKPVSGKKQPPKEPDADDVSARPSFKGLK